LLWCRSGFERDLTGRQCLAAASQSRAVRRTSKSMLSITLSSSACAG
jgi:hypothetical protein